MSAEQSRPDLYVVLGVPRDAIQAHLDRAYRALVRRHHPDSRAASDPVQVEAADATLRQIQAAYAVLGNPDRRAEYDQRNPEPVRPSRTIRIHIRPSVSSPFHEPPLRAGPVHWQPSPPESR